MYRDHDPFLRNTDGLIDFDRYRSDAYALRRQAMQESSKLSAVFKAVVIVVSLLGAVAVAPSRQDANATCRTCVGADIAADKASAAQRQSRSPWTMIPQQPPVY